MVDIIDMADAADADGAVVRVAVARHARFVAAFADELQARDPQGVAFDDSVDAVALARAAACRLIDTSRLWHELLGPVYDTEGVASVLADRASGQGRISRQAVHKRKLLALKTGSGRVVYPAFQFGESGGVVEGISEVVKLAESVSLSLWAMASWLASPEPELDGDRPIDWLRAGGHEAVLDVARRWVGALA